MIRKHKSAQCRNLWVLTGIIALWTSSVHGQLTDLTQTPNAAHAGIQKSYGQQIGTGRGDILTPESSIYIIKRDPFRSIRRGRQLFQRKFTLAQGLGPRTSDGVGNVEIDPSIAAGLGDSCASCHGRPRGAAGFGGDVFTRPDSRDAPHLFGLGLVEMLADEITHDLRRIRSEAIAAATAQAGGRPVARELTSKGISYGFITARPDGTVDMTKVQGINDDLRVRPFFAEGKTMSIREFVVGALNAEMGMEAADEDLLAAAAGADVVTPSGMLLSGSIDEIESPPVGSEGEDGDGDGVVNEVPTAIVDHFEFYLLNYFKPGSLEENTGLLGFLAPPPTSKGLQQFISIGCAECHVPNLLINHDRRVADVETAYNPGEPGFNHLFATAETRFDAVDDDSGHPTLKNPQMQPFLVRNIFADFKRHDLGPNFHERDFDGNVTTQFMTEPLWGVGTSAPYGHDGRSINLKEVILRHGGEAAASSGAFRGLGSAQQGEILAFLGSLVLFPPDDTASNLNPGNPGSGGFPQFGHGSINLGALFNNPSEGE